MSEPDPDELSPGERAALAAFAVPPPPPGLAERVLIARDRRGRLRYGAALAAVLLLAAAVLARWPGPRAGEVTAFAPAQIDLGRGVAEVAAGAALRYQISRGGVGRVEQTRGAVRYRIKPGGPFVVATPAGDVHVVGTAFTVELKPMNKPLAVAAVTTLLLIVYEGRVLLQNRHGSVAVGAGERAAAAADEAPILAGPAPPRPAAAPRANPVTKEVLAARAAERERLLQKLSTARSEHRAAAPSAGAPEPGSLEKEYVREQVREIIPLVKECYSNALEQKPTLAGRVMMKFVISGEPDIGGLVESAEVEEVSEGLRDPGLQECMRESMYAMRFKPPKGGGQVVVTYPFLLANGDGPPDLGESPPATMTPVR